MAGAEGLRTHVLAAEGQIHELPLSRKIFSTNTDLAAANADLTTCTGDLATCTGDLTTCTGHLTTCSGDLGTCNDALVACEAAQFGLPGDGTGNGSALAYQDCGDGTVADLKTALLWELYAIPASRCIGSREVSHFWLVAQAGIEPATP